MQMIRDNKSLRIDGDGTQSRDFIYVSDIISANIWCINNLERIEDLWYDIGYGETGTLNDIKHIADKYNRIKWDQAPDRKGDVKHTEISEQKLQKIGWTPKVDLKTGLKKCFKNLK